MQVMKYCTRCGKALPEGAAFCAGCGCPAPAPQPDAPPQAPPAHLLPSLSRKLKGNGILWLIIGIVQIALALFCMVLTGSFQALLSAVGVMNIISSISNLKYSKTVLQNPVGVVKRFEPLAGPIISLVYNAVFGGVIGIAGSIYYLTAIRSYVMNHRDAFLALERSAA